MGMRQNYLFPWGGEIPCSENIEPSYLQIFDNKYFVYEQFRMLYRFSGPSDCWKIPFSRFLPTRNFPVRRNFSGFMDFASKYWGRMTGRFPACGSFAYRADDCWTRGGTYAHGFENGRGRPHAPPLRQICRNALVAVACGYSLVCHRRCCCSIMANEKSQPIINQLRFYFRVPRTIFESCTFEPFVNTLIFNYL